MASPYVSTRRGGGQWIMQRASAAALVLLAGGHFALQHFTPAAVSTGLTVSARMNDPWWQAYYVVFIALALYHGINGVVGILRDYALPPRGRLIAELLLWSLAAGLAALGSINILSPRPLGEVKEIYARDGFVVGESRGSPPWAPAMRYDFSDELRELHLLNHYWTRHTHHGDEVDGPFTESIGGRVTPERVQAAGRAFDEWAHERVEDGLPPVERRDRGRIFSSDYEFAVWALNVRAADAARRGARVQGPALPPRKDAEPVPAYSAAATH